MLNNPKGDVKGQARRRYRRYRERLLTLLGGKCRRGFNDPRALQIDHVFNDGAEDRRKLRIKKNGSGAYQNYIAHVIKNIDSGRYQILCANCNAIKEFERRQEALKLKEEVKS